MNNLDGINGVFLTVIKHLCQSDWSFCGANRELSVAHGNLATWSRHILRVYNVFLPVIVFISLCYFTQLGAQLKDMY